jgi:hypothetical protein
MNMAEQKCLVPNCDAKVLHLRGLCRSCYLFAASLTFHKITTWEAMEAAKCVGPTGNVTQPPKRPERTAWFARACRMAPDVLTAELSQRNRKYESERRKRK